MLQRNMSKQFKKKAAGGPVNQNVHMDWAQTSGYISSPQNCSYLVIGSFILEPIIPANP